MIMSLRHNGLDLFIKSAQFRVIGKALEAEVNDSRRIPIIIQPQKRSSDGLRKRGHIGDSGHAELKRVDSFLADELLLLRFAAHSGVPREFALIEGYDLPRTAGFGLKKNEPRFTEFVNRTLLDLEATGEAAKIFDTWFAPLKRPFRIQPD